MQAFPLLCLTRVRRCGLDATAVSPAPPFSQIFTTLPTRSTAHANVACARCLQGRRGALEAARQSLGASQPRILGKWCRDTHGDNAIALREVIFAYPLPQVRLLSFADRRLLWSKHWCSQPFRCGL